MPARTPKGDEVGEAAVWGSVWRKSWGFCAGDELTLFFERMSRRYGCAWLLRDLAAPPPVNY